MMQRRAALTSLCAALGLPPAAAAAPRPVQVVQLPDPAAVLPATPPVTPLPLSADVRLPGRTSAHEVVAVGVGETGAPNGVRVTQRLVVRGTGDYTFFVPAPVVDVVAAPGSDSTPGLRPGQIVWQGFSSRRKVLAARADLQLARSVSVLPLRLRISGAPTRPGPFVLELSIENATRARVTAFSADARRLDAAAALDAVREAARAGRATVTRPIRVQGAPAPTLVAVAAPFTVRGLVRFPAGSVRGEDETRFSDVVPAAGLRIRVRGVATRAAAPSIRVTAAPSVGAPLARPPGESWVAAVRAGRVRLTGRRLLERAIVANLAYERARQYQTFLANPDPFGSSRTTYVYETARARRPAAVSRPRADGGVDVPMLAVVAGAALLGLGAVVLWAHL